MIDSADLAEELDISFAAHLIDGLGIADGSSTIDVSSPRHLGVIGEPAQAGTGQVDAAVAAAPRAFPAWRDTSARQRGRALMRIADDLEGHAERIARILSFEKGNALRTQSRGDIAFAVEGLRYFGAEADAVKGEQIPLAANRLDYSRHEPYGVVASIIPWKAPVQLGVMKIAPALATGDTLVLKSAEDAPFAVLEVAKIVAKHAPAGVLNVVHGTGPITGEALITHDDIDKTDFTGSTGVGSRILEAAAPRSLPVSLALGGKNPQIVFPGEQGLVHREFASKAGALTIGDPLDEATEIGAIVNRKQYDRVCGFVEEGLAVEGRRCSPPCTC